MQTSNTSSGSAPIVAVVRSVPAPGRVRRWRAGLPWPDRDVRVRVVDNPKPFDPKADDAVPEEISPAQLVDLRKDRRIAVYLEGSEGDPTAAIVAKAEAAKAEQALLDARRELAQAAEERTKAQSAAAEQAADAARRIQALEDALAGLQQQLQAAALSGGKKGRAA